MRGLGEHDGRLEVVAEADQQRFRAGDRAEERQHEVGEDVAVAVQRRDHERIAAGRDQQREGGVDQLRLVRHLGVAGGRRVHLLLQHPLVDRADRELRAAEHLRARLLGQPERELGDRVADAPLDSLGAERGLVVALALAPLLRAVGVADRHPHDRDRRVHAAEGNDPRDAPAGADDHAAADLLAEDPVRRADVLRAFRRDRRALQAAPGLAHGRRRVVHDAVRARAAILEREVVARQLDLEPDHVGREHAQRFFKQLLPGFVALEYDDRRARHQPPWISTARVWLHRKLYDQARRMATARLAAIPVRGLARAGDHGRGRAGAGRVSGHPARLEGRLDLAARRRKAAGDRRRQGGAPAIPLPPGISGAPGAGEIRQPRAVRGAATGAARGDGQAPGSGTARASNGQLRSPCG